MPAGTDVRFKLRTAPDSGGAPGTWTAWYGPGDTNIENYKFDVDADYSRASKIQVSSSVAKLFKGLAEYQYYNMDQVIARALYIFNNYIKND